MPHLTILLLLAAVLGRSAAQSGLTFSICSTDADCVSPRSCASFDEERPCSPSDVKACRCVVASGLTACLFALSCPSGERCFTSSDFSSPFCLDAKAGLSFGFPVGEADQDGLTYELCATSIDCASGRDCVVITEGGLVSCDGAGGCLCLTPTPVRCNIAADCDPGEVCEDFLTQGVICVSADTIERLKESGVVTPSTNAPTTSAPTTSAPTTSVLTTSTTSEDVPPAPNSPEDTTDDPAADGDTDEEEEAEEEEEESMPEAGEVLPDEGSLNGPENPELEQAVCMDSALLSHLPRASLVFPTHRHTRVLCDAAGSCATAGHMVRFRGEPLMMGSYCARVGCARKVVRVNSPRYQRALLVGTRTEGLMFTAFAARYATRAEEVLLKLAVRAGL